MGSGGAGDFFWRVLRASLGHRRDFFSIQLLGHRLRSRGHGHHRVAARRTPRARGDNLLDSKLVS